MSIRRRGFELSLPQVLREMLCGLPILRDAFVVGGSVRDALLGLPGKDFDVEVFGQSYEAIQQGLAQHGRVDTVGRSFGVIKLTVQPGETFDFSLPRRDSKVGAGHRGFIADFDPTLTYADAAARRDFTLNSLMYDPRTREILDCHGGLADLENRLLRHTSDAFVEDPLRVLRGMQFVSRFDLEAHPATLALCRDIRATYPELAKDRVRDEWLKWATRSLRPSRGLRFLVDTGWIEHFPELEKLVGTPQDPEWHPEGDVFVHTAHCCDAMACLDEWRSADEESRATWMLAILAHDFGKPSTTRQEMKRGLLRWVSPEHEAAGVPLANTFLDRLGMPNVIRERVPPLVENHLAHMQIRTDKAIRRLANRMVPETIEGLCLVMTADAQGRPPRPKDVPEGVDFLLKRSKELSVDSGAPKPLLQGRHLLNLGMQPGKPVGQITAAAFEAQLEGAFFDLPGAMSWLRLQASLPVPEALRARLDDAGSSRSTDPPAADAIKG